MAINTDDCYSKSIKCSGKDIIVHSGLDKENGLNCQHQSHALPQRSKGLKGWVRVIRGISVHVNLSGTGLHRLSWKRGHQTGVALIIVSPSISSFIFTN